MSVGGVLVIATGGRLLGFAREVLISSQYGTGPAAEAFFTVQQVPTIVSSFVFGPFMIAYVPYYAGLRLSGIEGEAFRRTYRTAVRIGLLITILMLIVGSGSVRLELGPSIGEERLIGTFLQILALSILPLIVSGLATVVLHARGHHVLAMAIAALAPAGMLASLLFLTAVPIVGHSAALPWSLVAGSFLSAAVGTVSLRRMLPADRPSPAVTAPFPGAAKFHRQLVASSIENVGFSVNQALTVFFAAGLGGGAVAINAYAFRIAAFAFSLVSPLNISVQTWMTRDRRHREGRRVMGVFGAMAGFVMAIAVALIIFAGPLVSLVYERGSFTERDAANVTALLTPYAVYGAITALNQLMARYLFVLHEGARYSRVMVSAYVAGNFLKAALVAPAGLEGLIWASVLAEGTALAYFTLYLVRTALAGAQAEVTDNRVAEGAEAHDPHR
ncbi:MAG: lipid II flippase MurJ [Vicinamibacterales bacterium]